MLFVFVAFLQTEHQEYQQKWYAPAASNIKKSKFQFHKKII